MSSLKPTKTSIKLGLKNPYIMGCHRFLFKMSVDSQYVYSMIWKQNDYYQTHGVEYVASRGQNYQQDHTQAYEIRQDPYQ